ncbi:uncharacterized protein LOC107040414 [Diachasma alloeum]|uniref:uncharacterized protein LOC107040414 n=1 Tax=Diachasma alloeum TaxID=454923 RepID=UPI0007384363|nr:uncharacterized protein LOC107040414 [Diachasma alloeum]
MWRGPEPGSARCEVTWKKVKNTVSQRMEDDSLIHLFTEKKTLKRRTKLLNSHLRQPANHTISYANYIKAKTAILRTFSEDEETSDSDLSDDLSRPHDESANPRSSALQTLLKDMMLESPDSGDELEPRKKAVVKRGRGRPRGGLRSNPRRRKNSRTSGSESEWERAPVAVVKRPRGRPRKYPLTGKTPVTTARGGSLRSSKIGGKCGGVEGRDDNIGDESTIADFESSRRKSGSRKIVGEEDLNVDEELEDLDSSRLIREKDLKGQDGKFSGRKLRSRRVDEEEDSDDDESEFKWETAPVTRASSASLRSSKIGGKCRDGEGRISNVGDESTIADVESSRKDSKSRKIVEEKDLNVDEESEDLDSSSLIRGKDLKGQDDKLPGRKPRSGTGVEEEDLNVDVESSRRKSESRKIVEERDSNVVEESEDLDSSSFIQVKDQDDKLPGRKSKSGTGVEEKDSDVDDESEASEPSTSMKGDKPEVLEYSTRPRQIVKKRDSSGDDELEKPKSSTLNQENKFVDVDLLRRRLISRTTDQSKNLKSSSPDERRKSQDVEYSGRVLRSRTISKDNDPYLDDESKNLGSPTSTEGRKSQSDFSSRKLRSRTISTEKHSNPDDEPKISESPIQVPGKNPQDVSDQSKKSKSPASTKENKSPVESPKKTSRIRILEEGNSNVDDKSNKLKSPTASQDAKFPEKISDSRTIFKERDSNNSDKSEKPESSIPEIVTVIINDHQKNLASHHQETPNTVSTKPTKPSAVKKPNYSNDVNTHIFEKISRLISSGVDPHLAADASRIYSTDGSTNGQETPGAYSTDEREFLTPQTSDCEDLSGEDEKKHSTLKNPEENPLESAVNVSGEDSMDNDDMFEEEKMITQSQMSIADASSHFESQNDHKDEVEREIAPKKSPKSPAKNSLVCQDDFLQEEKHLGDTETNIEDSKSEILNDEKEKSDCVDTNSMEIPFTQEFDAKEDETIKNIEEYVENVVKEFDEKFPVKTSPPTNENPASFEESRAPGKPIEKREELNNAISRDSIKSTGKASLPSGSARKIVRSPKTPEDVKRNLMETLDRISNESSPGIIKNPENNSNSFQKKISTPDPPLSSLDGEDSRPDDEFSVAPADSGIDEESQNVSPHEYRIFKEEGLNKSRENTVSCSASKSATDKIFQEEQLTETQQKIETSPSKKVANLKITCTELLKSKYLIVKNRKDGDEEKLMSSEASPTAPGKVGPRSEAPDALEEPLDESEDDQVRLQCPGTSDEDVYNNFSSFGGELDGYNSDGDDYGASDPGFPSRHEEDEWERSRREERMSLAVASESESLKYVLNSLVARGNQRNGWCEEEGDLLQEELLVGKGLETGGGLGPPRGGDRVLSRPTSIPEFVEGSDLVPFEALPSFTLGDIGEDDDIYLMEIPKSILQRDLGGQRFRLGEGKIFIGEGRYEVQRKEAAAMSCILHCGDKRNRFKTGIIEPVEHIIVRQQFRDDVMTTPKIELESRMSVPFPKNIKSRNPLILAGETSDNDQLDSTTIEDEEGDSQEEKIWYTRRRKRSANEISDESERISGNRKHKRPRITIESQDEDEIEELEHSDDKSNVFQNDSDIQDLKKSPEQSKERRHEDEQNTNLGEHEGELRVTKKEEKCERLEGLASDHETSSILQDNSEITKEEDEEPQDNLVINPLKALRERKKYKQRKNSFTRREDETLESIDADFGCAKEEEKCGWLERAVDDQECSTILGNHSGISEEEREDAKGDHVIDPLIAFRDNINTRRRRNLLRGRAEETDGSTRAEFEGAKREEKSGGFEELPDGRDSSCILRNDLDRNVEESGVSDQHIDEVLRKPKKSRKCNNSIRTLEDEEKPRVKEDSEADQQNDNFEGLREDVSCEEPESVIDGVAHETTDEESQVSRKENKSEGLETSAEDRESFEIVVDQKTWKDLIEGPEIQRKKKKTKKVEKYLRECQDHRMPEQLGIPSELEKSEDLTDESDDKNTSRTSQNRSESEVSQDQSNQNSHESEQKKKSKKLRKLLSDHKSLVDFQNNSERDIKEDEELEDSVKVLGGAGPSGIFQNHSETKFHENRVSQDECNEDPQELLKKKKKSKKLRKLFHEPESLIDIQNHSDVNMKEDEVFKHALAISNSKNPTSTFQNDLETQDYKNEISQDESNKEHHEFVKKEKSKKRIKLLYEQESLVDIQINSEVDIKEDKLFKHSPEMSVDENPSSTSQNYSKTRYYNNEISQDASNKEDHGLVKKKKKSKKLRKFFHEQESLVDIQNNSDVDITKDEIFIHSPEMSKDENPSSTSQNDLETQDYENEIPQAESDKEDHELVKKKKSKKHRKLFHEQESLVDIQINSDVDIKEELFKHSPELSVDENPSSSSQNYLETQDYKNEISQDESNKEDREVLKKKKSKKLRKLFHLKFFHEQESLINIQNNSDVEIKEDEELHDSITPEASPSIKKNKKYKKHKKSCQDQEVLIIAQNASKIEVKEDEEENQSRNQEFKVPKIVKKSKKRKGLSQTQESSDTSDISGSEVDSNFKTKKRKKRCSGNLHKYDDFPNVVNEEVMPERGRKEKNDEVKIPKKSFYEQMMEDSD